MLGDVTDHIKVINKKGIFGYFPLDQQENDANQERALNNAQEEGGSRQGQRIFESPGLLGTYIGRS